MRFAEPIKGMNHISPRFMSKEQRKPRFMSKEQRKPSNVKNKSTHAVKFANESTDRHILGTCNLRKKESTTV